MDAHRLLRPLAVLAVAAVLAAVIALIADRPVNLRTAQPDLLPDFAARIDQAARLDITHGLGLSGHRTLGFTRQAEIWTADDRAGYPAKQELVNETLLALANLEPREARTARPEWHRALGLYPPEELGRAIRFKVRDSAGEVLAEILLGDEARSEAERGLPLKTLGPELRDFYVRLPDDDQSWLVRGRLPRNGEVAAWLDPSLPHGTEMPVGVKVRVPDAPPVEMRRDADGVWRFADNTIWEAAADWLAHFQSLRFQDVARAEGIDFDAASTLTLVFADKTELRYESVGAGTHIWSRAIGAPDRYEGWAFRFDAEAAAVLLPDFASAP